MSYILLLDWSLQIFMGSSKPTQDWRIDAKFINADLEKTWIWMSYLLMFFWKGSYSIKAIKIAAVLFGNAIVIMEASLENAPG